MDRGGSNMIRTRGFVWGIGVGLCATFWLAIILLLTGCAATTSGVQLPPERFRHDTVVAVKFETDAAMRCQEIGAPPGSAACFGQGLAIMPNPCDLLWSHEIFARLMCHEIGHRNGWPADHPR